ncbi:MAG: D-alanyl-D-alanine carboxypeptidase family protein [bacterium]
MAKLPEDGMFSYKQEDLDAMKELLQKTTTEKELTDLKKAIKKGQDPTKEKIQSTPTSPKSVAEKTSDISLARVTEAGALLGGTLVVITQADLDILQSEKGKIKPEITGDFASIKKIKNSKGAVILEGTGETPYIHKDIWDDIVTLALLFYTKTGQALSLNSTFRTHTHQEELKKEKKDLAAEPGHSGHETGRSFDVNAQDKNEKAI